MKNETEFRKVVAENLTMYRKSAGLTQLQLAEKLNYSDKAVSKWERGESLPDLYMLQTIAEMFGITLNDLVDVQIQPKKKKNILNNRVILLLSVGLTWLVAMVAFVVLKMTSVDMVWMPFIYAIPVSFIVSTVFCKLYDFRFPLFISISGIFWSIPLALCMQLRWQYNIEFTFLIGIPLQILTVLWFFRKKN